MEGQPEVDLSLNPPTKDEKNWAVGLHLSFFAGWLIPLAGLVAPIIIWNIKKDESKYLDVHGKEVVNFIITHIIVAAVGLILCLIFIGLVVLIALSIYSIIVPIIAAVKASEGEYFRYPFIFRFIK